MKPNETAPEVLRRPIRARDSAWAARTARSLARWGFRPNHISVGSMIFGAGAGLCFLLGGLSPSPVGKILFLLAAAAGMQLRLLCNLFDGMVAIEGGFKTKSGEVFNELPDRVSDILIFLGAGYSLPSIPWVRELGWAAALLSVLTAYIRAFGGAAGARQHFCGPMAKQQRMAVMTVSALASALLAVLHVSFEVLPWALALVVLGCNITIFRRTLMIVADLESK